MKPINMPTHSKCPDTGRLLICTPNPDTIQALTQTQIALRIADCDDRLVSLQAEKEEWLVAAKEAESLDVVKTYMANPFKK